MIKCLKKDRISFYFLIGAVLGLIFFVLIYGVGVLNFTNDDWLLTGKDLQQHYIGWKYFRDAEWTFPPGMHNSLTHPYYIGVIYTDSIPLFALIFKLLSPILPETFQYFGLFGLMCFMLNGGMASVLIAKYNQNRLFCMLGSVFFILSTPVLQRLFGLLTEDSRHTSLAAHFLILGALAVWVYRDRFKSRKKAAVAFSILGCLCVLIQMYMIFIVGGIMCGYLLHCLLRDRDWKRLAVVFPSFLLSSFVVFYMVGGLTSVLKAAGGGFGLYSANLNALINPYNYSTFFGKLPWNAGQYEGFCYLGLGMYSLFLVCLILFVAKLIKIGDRKAVWEKIKGMCRSHRPGVISLAIVVIVFAVLAVTHMWFWGNRIVLQVFLPEKWIEVLATFRSSGRFMWVIMYLLMILALCLLTHFVKNRRVQLVILAVCVCLQILDLSAPIWRIHTQYTTEEKLEEEDIYARDPFWTTKLGDYKHIVYYPMDSCLVYQMLQIGTKASYFGLDMNYFYTSRFYTKKATRDENRRNRNIFQQNQLSDDTVYVVDYKTAHKYKDRCNLYLVDNLIVALKNPVDGLQPYNDAYLSTADPVLEYDFSYNGNAREFAHNGWNLPDYGEDGMWTSSQSVLKIYSGGAKKAHIKVEYKAGKKKGMTKIRLNGKQKEKINNKSSGTVEFDVELKETLGKKTDKGVNWLFFNTDGTFKVRRRDTDEQRGIYITKITVTCMD